MNYTIAFLVLLTQVGLTFSQSGSFLGVSSCQCKTPLNQRVACPGGENLTEDECLASSCCYKTAVPAAQDSTAYPACFAPKESCLGQCDIVPYMRAPCGLWSAGQSLCDAVGCCYDRRMFPYCFYPADSTPPEPGTVPITTTPATTLPPTTQAPVVPGGPNLRFFDPVNSYFITVDCRDMAYVEPCGASDISREECLLESCCWKSMLGIVGCYRTVSTHETQGDNTATAESIGAQLRQRLSVGEELEPDTETDSSPLQSYNYGNFSVALECPGGNRTNETTMFPCATNEINECLDRSCCWSDGHCYVPITSFQENITQELFSDVALFPAMMHDAEYWIPSRINLRIILEDDGDDFQVACSVDKVSLPCGENNISRSECIALGCCWRPEYAAMEELSTVCMLPTIERNKNKTQIDRNEAMLNWLSWGSWSECMATSPCSEDGIKHRSRICPHNSTTQDTNSAMPENRCSGSAYESETCYGVTTCVVAGWTAWSGWSACDNHCGAGLTRRERFCKEKKDSGADIKNPECQPIVIAVENTPSQIQEEVCNSNICDVWASWSSYTPCDAPCESEGYELAVRKCLNGRGQNQVESCEKKRIRCFGPPVCLQAWSEWQEWSSCSQSCSNGTRTRIRSCVHINGTLVSPNKCGKGNSDQEMESCNTDLCLQWGDWEVHGECNADCEENGTRQYVKTCLNPVDFTDVDDSCRIKFEPCIGSLCPGTWGSWFSWSECGDVCGPSTKSRTRDCYVKEQVFDDVARCQDTNPGSSDTNETTCNDNMCPEWSDWIDNNDCNAPCRSNGNQSRFKQCLNSTWSEQYDENMLVHDPSCYQSVVACTGAPICPPEWNEWQQWSSCSESCTNGTRIRERSCKNENGTIVSNEECIGANGHQQSEACNMDLCLEWGDWEVRGECNADCEENGTLQYVKTCLNPAHFTNVDDSCRIKFEPCIGSLCRGTWGSWFSWSECGDVCGPSTKSRTRDCYVKEEVLNDVTRCQDTNPGSSETNETTCNDNMCPEWSDWIDNNDCNAPCRSNGNQSRYKTCLNSTWSEQYEENMLVHDPSCYQSVVACTGAPICPPEWNEWQQWSSCSESCTNGTRIRERSCRNENGTVVSTEECIGQIAINNLKYVTWIFVYDGEIGKYMVNVTQNVKKTGHSNM
uniref:A disintegrin and metalloproteinase with thrombospondin motifs adt-1-like n=1 Tax=Ciona intestinalis TaxID=7719 RepID=UPI00089DD2AD|nr:A disintegrin and metalloproteinase with thrombospondin motifs adt-1-like [Ciona intestinalis]|eukprot:XP_018672591.1 A disintegrin and metalloproteinase with thrombospondin motifs adt-1-like [Ciona intestinalis]